MAKVFDNDPRIESGREEEVVGRPERVTLRGLEKWEEEFERW